MLFYCLQMISINLVLIQLICRFWHKLKIIDSMKYNDSIFIKYRQFLTYSIIALATFSIIINSFYRQPLYEMGLDIITSMQEHHTTYAVSFFIIISFISDPTTVLLAILLIILVQRQKKHAFNVIIYLFLNIYFITLLKSYFSDPRPFWNNSQIDSLSPYCPGQFGNPSGHSWFTAVASFVILFEYAPHFQKILGLFFVGLIIILVPLSRMYLGAHSLNQVVMGVLMGLSMNILYFCCNIKKLIDKFLQNFNNEPMLGWKKYMVLLHILYFITYFRMNTKIKQQSTKYQRFSLNIISQCSKQFNVNHMNFMLLLMSSLIVNFISGIALGYDSMSSTEKGRKYLQGRWQINQQKFTMKIGKFLYYLVQIVCLALGILFSALLYAVFKNFGQIQIFLIFNIGACLSGYCYSSKSCKLLYHYSIVIETL